MIDMLVRLYDLPSTQVIEEDLSARGVIIRRANAYEKHIVCGWVGRHFSPKWVSETEIAFTRQPVTCFIATKDKNILGFACCDVTSRGFLGPMGVSEDSRMGGLGKVLLVRALEHLRSLGYAYGIIGGVGPEEFYRKSVGAISIPDSSPGIYVDILPDKLED